jgi:hypothetical protein
MAPPTPTSNPTDPMLTWAQQFAAALDRVVDEVHGLASEVHGLRLAVEQQRRTVTPREEADELLKVLAAAVGTAAFSATEAFHHAHVVPGDLQAALSRADISSPQRLGKLLKRHVGAIVGHVRLCRIGVDRSGVIWSFCECED